MPVINIIHYPKEYLEVADVVANYRETGVVLVSLEEAISEEEARKVKDYLLGYTFAKHGFAFQYNKTMLFSFLKEPKLNDCQEIGGWPW